MIRGLAIAAALAVGACSPGTGVPYREGCGESLSGSWRVVRGGAAIDWGFLEHGDSIEAYALSRPGASAVADQAQLPPGIVSAPAYLDLTRGDSIAGSLKRRYMRGDKVCIVSTPARVLGCYGDAMELSAGELAPPTDFETCAAPSARPVVLTLKQLR